MMFDSRHARDLVWTRKNFSARSRDRARTSFTECCLSIEKSFLRDSTASDLLNLSTKLSLLTSVNISIPTESNMQLGNAPVAACRDGRESNVIWSRVGSCQNAFRSWSWLKLTAIRCRYYSPSIPQSATRERIATATYFTILEREPQPMPITTSSHGSITSTAATHSSPLIYPSKAE